MTAEPLRRASSRRHRSLSAYGTRGFCSCNAQRAPTRRERLLRRGASAPRWSRGASQWTSPSRPVGHRPRHRFRRHRHEPTVRTPTMLRSRVWPRGIAVERLRRAVADRLAADHRRQHQVHRVHHAGGQQRRGWNPRAARAAAQQERRSADRRRRMLLISFGLFGARCSTATASSRRRSRCSARSKGLKVVAPQFDAARSSRSTIAILLALCSSFQRYGTGAVGTDLRTGDGALVRHASALLGVREISREPRDPARRVNPWYGLQFFVAQRPHGFLVLGAVVLAVTGAEALYADMGHFGKRPIRLAWFGLVFPALLLNYFGQGALVLARPAAASNPFYLLAPSALLLPLVVLATWRRSSRRRR